MKDVLLVVHQCLEGDGDSWRFFVREFSSVAKNIIAGSCELVSDEQDDVVQNIFIKLIRGGLKNFNGISKYEFLKYFKVIVLNEMRSYLSAKRGGEQTVSLNDVTLHVFNQDEGDAITFGDMIEEQHKGTMPDVLLEERDLLERVMHIIKDEPFLDKQVFIMKIDGYKDEEIKEILKIPMGTVASKFSRIKARIKAELGEE